MEYQVCLWKDPEGEEHLLVRTHFNYGGILQGKIFQKYLYERFGHDEIISIVRDENGVNTTLKYAIPLLLTDNNLNDLEWENYRWGESDEEE